MNRDANVTRDVTEVGNRDTGPFKGRVTMGVSRGRNWAADTRRVQAEIEYLVDQGRRRLMEEIKEYLERLWEEGVFDLPVADTISDIERRLRSGRV